MSERSPSFTGPISVDPAALLDAYDTQLRPWIDDDPTAGVRTDRIGPIVRVVGRAQGFVEGPRDLGIGGDEVHALIAEQRDFFAARGEEVEWKTRAHDLPADIPERLIRAGFVPQERETVMIGETAALTRAGSAPEGVRIRQTREPADFVRIAAMESEVWGRTGPGWRRTWRAGRRRTATGSSSTSPKRRGASSPRRGWW